MLGKKGDFNLEYVILFFFILLLGSIGLFFYTHQVSSSLFFHDISSTSQQTTTHTATSGSFIAEQIPVYPLSAIKKVFDIKYLYAGHLLYIKRSKASFTHNYNRISEEGIVVYEAKEGERVGILTTDNKVLYIRIPYNKHINKQAQTLWLQGRLWKRVRDFVNRKGGWMWARSDGKHIQILLDKDVLFDVYYKGKEKIKEGILSYKWEVCYYDYHNLFPQFPVAKELLKCSVLNKLPLLIQKGYHYVPVDDWDNIIVPLAIYKAHSLAPHKTYIVNAPLLDVFVQIKKGEVKYYHSTEGGE